MRPFDSILVVDWSSGNDTGPRPRADAVWTALACDDGRVAPPVYHRNRQAAEAAIAALPADERAAGRRVLAGVHAPLG